MKRIRELLIVAALAALLIACATVGAAPRAEPAAVPPPPSQGPPRTITVVGMGKVSVVPDIARVSAGAEVKASTVSGAKDEVDRQMEAIMAALLAMGIDEQDIQTSHYSVHYEREPTQMPTEGPPGKSEAGYRVSSLLRVTVRDVETAGDVLDAVVEAGANEVHGVTFTASDESRWQGQARENAMADAKARAGELAGLAGVELGAIQSVSEVIGSWPMPTIVVREPGMGGAFAPGELELSTQVQVAYTIQ
jgi:uncharacterized protein YggE